MNKIFLSFLFLITFFNNLTFAGTIDVKINRLTERMGPGACFVDFEATNNSNYNIQQFYLNFVAKDSNDNLIKEQTGSISSLRPGTNKTSGSTGMIGSVSCSEIALIEISWHDNLKLADGRWLTEDKHIAELEKLSATTNIFWKDSRIKASSTTFKIQQERSPAIAADPDLVIPSDRDLMTMSPLMQKKLNMNKGKTILVKSVHLWKFDKSEWLQGGPLHLMNDDSLGKATRLTCTISAEDGDKFMENPQRQDVSMKGILKGFDGSSGTHIEPCKVGPPIKAIPSESPSPQTSKQRKESTKSFRDPKTQDGPKTVQEYIGIVAQKIGKINRYPQLARRRGITGKVVIEFTILKTGELGKLKIIKSSHDILTKAAIKAIERSVPFPKFPNEINKESLAFQMPFNYQM